MEDPTLNRAVEEMRELNACWAKFNEYFKKGTSGEPVAPEDEHAFLNIKTRIAMLHDGFMRRLKHDHEVGQQVLSILSQCILLRRLRLMNGSEVQKIQLDWNEAYLLMQETIANLEDERNKMANINVNTYKLQQAKKKTLDTIQKILSSFWFKLSVTLFALFFFTAGVQIFGIYKWRDLRSDVPFTKPAVDRVVELIRQYINPEIFYFEFEEVPAAEGVDTEPGSTDVGVPNNMKDKTFFNDRIANLGFSSEDLAAAIALVNKVQTYRVEKREETGGKKDQLVIYYLFFEETAQAVEFIELQQAGINARPSNEQQLIRDNISLYRKANLVICSISPRTEFRDQYVRDKWGVDDDNLAR